MRIIICIGVVKFVRSLTSAVGGWTRQGGRKSQRAGQALIETARRRTGGSEAAMNNGLRRLGLNPG